MDITHKKATFGTANPDGNIANRYNSLRTYAFAH